MGFSIFLIRKIEILNNLRKRHNPDKVTVKWQIVIYSGHFHLDNQDKSGHWAVQNRRKLSPTERLHMMKYRGINANKAESKTKKAKNYSQIAFILTTTSRVFQHKPLFLSVWPQSVSPHVRCWVKVKTRRVQRTDRRWSRFVYTELASWLVRQLLNPREDR